jgi:hypothetical protein
MVAAACARACFLEVPEPNAATATLAARRFTSICKIDARQRLVEIIDVEKNVIFGGDEGAEIHQMAVAASLYRKTSGWLTGKVCCHYRSRSTQESKWIN